MSVCSLSYFDQSWIDRLRSGHASIFASALAVRTEWQQFRAPDFDEMQSRLGARVIVDGRNLFHPDRLRTDGWSYYSVGRA